MLDPDYISPEDTLRDILARFEQNAQDPELDPLLERFTDQVTALMQGMRKPFVTLWPVDYDELLRFEGVHYLLYDYGLRLTLLEFSYRLMLSVEPLPEGSDYQGLVTRTQAQPNPLTFRP